MATTALREELWEMSDGRLWLVEFDSLNAVTAWSVLADGHYSTIGHWPNEAKLLGFASYYLRIQPTYKVREETCAHRWICQLLGPAICSECGKTYDDHDYHKDKAAREKEEA